MQKSYITVLILNKALEEMKKDFHSDKEAGH